MNKLREPFWKLGIALNWTTFGLTVCILVACVSVCIFGFFPAWAQNRIVRILLVLLMIPAMVVVFGSLYRTMMWGFSDKKGRAQIEKEMAVKILQDHYKEEEAIEAKKRKRSQQDL
ncbi:hypothetical protein ccbrp13_68810 [Ktedonobacteria bacterium brp13]|nr:hypothetical protein ccbrp13_68810 [Ktedonobacteria bacterium brp13]